MGIISALITGGTLIGKVCQALSGNMKSAVDEATGTVVEMAGLETCGVKFMKINSEPYMLNTLEQPVDVTVPNVATGNVVSKTIGPGNKQSMANMLSSDISPETEAIIGPVESGENDANGNAVKLGFNRLEIGGAPVSVAGYGISAKINSLTVQTSENLPTLNYFNFRNDRGVSIVNQEKIEGKFLAALNNEFEIPFGSYGITKGDVLSGSLYFSVAGMKRTLTSDGAASEPLTDAEKRCLAQLGVHL